MARPRLRARPSSPRTTHGAEIHVPPTRPAPRSPRPSTPSPKNGDAAGRTARRRTTPSLSRGRTWGVRGFAWGDTGGGPRGRGGGDRVGPGPDLRPALRVRGGFGYRGARGTDHRHERGGALRRCSTEARPCRGRSTLCSPNGKTPAAWGGISFVRRHCFCYKPATNITSRVIGNHWGAA